MTFPLNDREEIAVMHLIEKWCNNQKTLKLNPEDTGVLEILNVIFCQKQQNTKGMVK